MICTQSVLSLSRGDADLAVRFTERPPDTLVGHRLGTVAYGIYRAAGEERDEPAGIDGRDRIGLHDETFNRKLYGTFLPRTRLKHRVDSMEAMHAMGARASVSRSCRATRPIAILRCAA